MSKLFRDLVSSTHEEPQIKFAHRYDYVGPTAGWITDKILWPLFDANRKIIGKIIEAAGGKESKLVRVKIKLVSLKTREIKIIRCEEWTVPAKGGSHRITEKYNQCVGKSWIITKDNIKNIVNEMTAYVKKETKSKYPISFGGDFQKALYQIGKRIEEEEKKKDMRLVISIDQAKSIATNFKAALEAFYMEEEKLLGDTEEDDKDESDTEDTSSKDTESSKDNEDKDDSKDDKKEESDSKDDDKESKEDDDDKSEKSESDDDKSDKDDESDKPKAKAKRIVMVSTRLETGVVINTPMEVEEDAPEQIDQEEPKDMPANPDKEDDPENACGCELQEEASPETNKDAEMYLNMIPGWSPADRARANMCDGTSTADKELPDWLIKEEDKCENCEVSNEPEIAVERHVPSNSEGESTNQMKWAGAGYLIPGLHDFVEDTPEPTREEGSTIPGPVTDLDDKEPAPDNTEVNIDINDNRQEQRLVDGVSPETTEMLKILDRVDTIIENRMTGRLSQEGFASTLTNIFVGILDVIGHFSSLLGSTILHGWRDFKMSELSDYLRSNMASMNRVYAIDYNQIKTVKVCTPQGMEGTYAAANNSLLECLAVLNMTELTSKMLEMSENILKDQRSQNKTFSAHVSAGTKMMKDPRIKKAWLDTCKHFTSKRHEGGEFGKLFSSMEDYKAVIATHDIHDSHFRAVAGIHDRLEDISKTIQQLMNMQENAITVAQAHDLSKMVRLFAECFDQYGTVMTDLNRMNHNLTFLTGVIRKIAGV